MSWLEQIYSMGRKPLGASDQPSSGSSGGSALEAVRSAAGAPLGGGGDVKQIISSAAKTHGVPEDLLHNIAGSESSYKANVSNKTGSSAKGLFQFIDSTWKGMGGRPGEQFIPEKNADLGAKYVKQNIETLRGNLRRDPTYGEVYAAHYFGPGVSKMLNRANPSAPIERGLSTFNSPDKVRAIMQQNPNLRGKSVGEVLESLHKKAGYKTVGSGGKQALADGAGDEGLEQPTQMASADAYGDAWDNDNFAPDEYNREQQYLA
jgi:hypothetical protein